MPSPSTENQRLSSSGRRRQLVLRRWLTGLAVALCLGADVASAQCNFDVDGNGKVDALTDGLLIARAGFGLAGPSLVQGALGSGATRTSPEAIADFINANRTQYDLDGNGTFDALTDGVMIVRAMFGLSGAAVTSGAIGASAKRGDWIAINAYLANGCVNAPSGALQLKGAARLLTQATWGPTYAEIHAVAASTADAWITQQFAQPLVPHVRWIDAKAAQGFISTADTYESFWTQALTGPDQLRQRVAYALSQIMVVSDQQATLAAFPYSIAGYYDILNRNAFGNFRTLLEEITKSPAMGVYLDMVCNERETDLRAPNENYARELLQLFSIGTVWLNQNGTVLMAEPNQPIPTYNQSVVQGFAKVFTGWSYANPAWCSAPVTIASGRSR